MVPDVAMFGLLLVTITGLVTGNQDGYLSCSWDRGLCGWHKPRGDRFKFNSERSVRSHGKVVVATPNSIDDTFLWAAGGDFQALSHDNLAVLQSVEFYNPAPGALRFWHVADAPSLYVNVTLDGVTRTVQRYARFATHWTQRIVKIPGPGRCVITIAASPVGHGIDEIEYSRDAEIAVFREVIVPFERPVVQDRIVSCSFRHTMCGWSAYPGMDGNWLPHNSTHFLPAGFIKESSNHWHDAWFLAVNKEFHDEFEPDSQAAIVTEPIRQDGPSWLSFWWAKHEAEAAASAIFVKVVTEHDGVQPVFDSKLPMPHWTSQNISIPQTGLIRIIIGFQLTTADSHGVLDEIQFSGDLISHEVISSTIDPEGSGDEELFLPFR